MWIADLLISLVPDLIKKAFRCYKKHCEIRLAPAIYPSIPEIMNGGHVQEFVNIQVRFGSETDLELVDAVISVSGKKIGCENRESRLNGGKDWNSFRFKASELEYVPDQKIDLIIRVSDHVGHCCELSLDFQMKQFPHKDLTGINSGRWEIQPKGIFRIKGARKNGRPLTS